MGPVVVVEVHPIFDVLGDIYDCLVAPEPKLLVF